MTTPRATTRTAEPAAPGGRSIGSVVLSYAVFAGLWFLGSDWLLGMLVRDPVRLTQLSTLKGWFFVAVTAALLYLLMRRLPRLPCPAGGHAGPRGRRPPPRPGRCAR